MEPLNRLHSLPDDLVELVWGPAVYPRLFVRWSQGFLFSDTEFTALVQTSSGPCAVIAPVQAFIMKRLTSLYSYKDLLKIDKDSMNEHLISVLGEILLQGIEQTTSNDEASSNLPEEGPYRLACLDDPLPSPGRRSPTTPAEIDAPLLEPSCNEIEHFHSLIRVRYFGSIHDLDNYLQNNLDKFKNEFGILLFLYSVILTRGVSRVREEVGDSGESLINNSEGHGNQALINLLICGRATSFVWDGDKDVGGLTLSGIIKRPSVGFLTKFEDLHYVQVGWYLKNPTSPVWVLASETHLTVLFSWCQKLITPDSEAEKARQVLSWFDADGNKFIQKSQFKAVLSKLNLCTDNDFVEFMSRELDPDNIGVILFQSILDAFYETDKTYLAPDTFTVYHYNGLEASCSHNQLSYAEGCVTLQESHVQFQSNSDVVACLSTKWPNLDVQWTNFNPTLN